METARRPMTVAELLPGLSGIISEDVKKSLTEKKKPRSSSILTRTTEKNFKPLTIAQIRAVNRGLEFKSPVPPAQSSKKKVWNSSVKVDKKISHTSNGNMKYNSVKKALNFQPKVQNPKIVITPNLDTPKFPKPEVKKLFHLQARNTIRMSGVCNIQETPILNMKSNKKRLIQKEAIKENVSLNKPYKKEKNSITSLQIIHKKIPNKMAVLDTPLPNDSWNFGSDTSFLQKEKEINDVEKKVTELANEQTLENIAEISPPISTPFKEYRNVQEYFNNSSELETSALYNDNTIMCFEKPESNKENNREESVIVSLCDLLNKAQMSKQKTSDEFEDLLEQEQQIRKNIKLIDNAIQTLKNIKESQEKSFEFVKKLILEKNSQQKNPNTNIIENLVTPKETYESTKVESGSPNKSPINKISSVIKSPTYKIPKKNSCLRKKVFHKSMSNLVSPAKDFDGKALKMYMKIKQQMNFLSTPVGKNQNAEYLNTPAVTSHNLQIQLDRLYDNS
ncbi:hypothetical protein ACJJTC_008631 [Scirpophaga incertulas]